jgi:hypothetical protein
MPRYLKRFATYEANAPLNSDDPLMSNLENEESGEAATVFSTTVTLTDAQIKAMAGTPQEIVAAPGENKIIVVVSAVLGRLDESAGAYTNIDGAGVGLYLGEFHEIAVLNWGGASAVMGVLSGGEILSGPVITVIDYQNLAPGVNTPLELHINSNSGPLEGGGEGNTLKVSVIYSIIDV